MLVRGILHLALRTARRLRYVTCSVSFKVSIRHLRLELGIQVQGQSHKGFVARTHSNSIQPPALEFVAVKLGTIFQCTADSRVEYLEFSARTGVQATLKKARRPSTTRKVTSRKPPLDIEPWRM